jgi:chromosome segregation ATPase
MRTLFCSLPLRSAAAAAEEMVGLRAELSSVRQELESEKMNVRSLSTELATAHSATLRAEKQHEEILSVLEKRKHEMKEELKRVAYCHEEDIRKLKAEIRDLELDRRSGSQQTGEGVAARPVYNDSSQSSRRTSLT